MVANNILEHNRAKGLSARYSGNHIIVANNKVADPRFVSPVSSVPSTTHQAYSNDYRLGTGSPALGFAAVADDLPSSLDGVCRPQGGGPDLGAYEQ